MKLGFIILAHQHLHRTAEIAEYLAAQDCAVVIHIDRRAPAVDYHALQARLAANPSIIFSRRVFCEWGSFSLVKASQNAAEVLLETFPDVEHVALISGSCLPIRPIDQLKKFLSRNRATDFIESVSVETERWVKGGLNEERFTLFFPFSWRRQRKLFDLATKWQRRFNVSRKVPLGLKPHIGSQWWCLTRRTMELILNDENREDYDRYFARTWIPDESYFQTLARIHGEKIESRSLTFSRFDSLGKPFILYDDHLDLMRKTDCFFMRKVWPGAKGLYRDLLSDERNNIPLSKAEPREVEAYFDAKIVGRKIGGDGRYSVGRYPLSRSAKVSPAVRPYSVFIGHSAMFDGFTDWLGAQSKTLVHGHLFAKRGFSFADGAELTHGNLSANTKIRNRNPRSYLSNLIWNHRDQAQSFCLDIEDHPRIHSIIANDPNAKVCIIRGSWQLKLLAMKESGADTLSNAKRLQQSEANLISELKSGSAAQKLMVMDLQDVIDNPTASLTQALSAVGHVAGPVLGNIPIMADIGGLNSMIRSLRNQGMDVRAIELPKTGKDADEPSKGLKLVSNNDSGESA